MNNLPLFDLLVIIKNYSIHKLHVTGHAGSSIKGPATQNAVCRRGVRSLSAAECYIPNRLF